MIAVNVLEFECGLKLSGRTGWPMLRSFGYSAGDAEASQKQQGCTSTGVPRKNHT